MKRVTLSNAQLILNWRLLCDITSGHPKQEVVFRCALLSVRSLPVLIRSAPPDPSAPLLSHRSLGMTWRTDNQAWAFAERANRASIRPLSDAALFWSRACPPEAFKKALLFRDRAMTPVFLHSHRK